MKKSNKEILDSLGLKVGDRVKILNCDFCDYFVIKKGKDGFEYAESVHSYRPCNTWYLQTLASILLEYEYEIVKPKKKLGDMKCGEMSCNECPFISFDCSEWRLNSTNVVKNIPKATLYEVLEGFMTIYNFEKIREELDKEVEE